jgi:hypothetical protein
LSSDVINCPRCDRRTPAARGVCLYCGEALPLIKIEAAPPQRNIEPSEAAFNTVLEAAGHHASEAAEAALSSALQIELAEAHSFIASNKAIPIARSRHRQEAEMIAMLVRSCGLRASIVPDVELRLDRELNRARKGVLKDGRLRLRHSAGELELAAAEIKLIVLGALRNTRVDYTEGLRGGRPGQSGTNVIDSFQYTLEETLLDVYSLDLDTSFRVKADAFDYSGVVPALSFRAEMNFKTFLFALRDVAPAATLDDDFARVRGLLSRAWPERTRNEALGIKRTGIARKPVAQASVISDGRDQFDRYSRLMFLTSTSKAS